MWPIMDAAAGMCTPGVVTTFLCNNPSIKHVSAYNKIEGRHMVAVHKGLVSCVEISIYLGFTELHDHCMAACKLETGRSASSHLV